MTSVPSPQSSSAQTSIAQAPMDATGRQAAPVRYWSSRIGAVALIGIGVAHTVVNGRGFAAEPGGSWPIFLLFGPGVSVLAFVIAVVAWRYGSRRSTGVRGAATRSVVAAGAILLCFTAFSVLRSHPTLAWVPLGPGPWSVIGGPALLIATIAPSSIRHRARHRSAR